jgi:hypothetical protein
MAPASGAGIERCVGSSPTLINIILFFVFFADALCSYTTIPSRCDLVLHSMAAHVMFLDSYFSK